MTKVFISHAHAETALVLAQRAAQSAIDQISSHAADLLVNNALNDDLLDHSAEAAPDQEALARRLQKVMKAYCRYRGKVDPAQVMRAFLVAGWRYLQGLDEKEWDALTDVANDEVAALSLLCNPYDAVLGDNDEGSPIDH